MNVVNLEFKPICRRQMYIKDIAGYLQKQKNKNPADVDSCKGSKGYSV